MTYEQAKPLAKELAERELDKGFDVEAFLVLSAIKDDDEDEHIKCCRGDGLEMFVNTFNKKYLCAFLDEEKQIIAELKGMCDEDGMKFIDEFINELTLLLS